MQVPPQFAMFPAIDATLNGTSAVLLFIGRGFIKQGRMAAHRAMMIAALISSSVFLACYLYYHWHVGSIHFQGQGWSRPVYFHHSDFAHNTGRRNCSRSSSLR